MATDDDIKQMQKEIARIEVKIEHLEKDNVGLREQIKTLQKEIDEKIDELKKEINQKLDSIEISLKAIQDIVTEAKGGKKALGMVITVIVSVGAVATWVYNFLKP